MPFVFIAFLFLFLFLTLLLDIVFVQINTNNRLQVRVTEVYRGQRRRTLAKMSKPLETDRRLFEVCFERIENRNRGTVMKYSYY